MQIHSIRVKNFKVLRDVYMKEIPQFAVLIGANGSGKSTFIDVFGFLKDCLVNNVRTAVQKRAGFPQLLSRDADKPCVSIELKVELDFSNEKSRLVTYAIEIGEHEGRTVVLSEKLSWKRGSYGRPFNFIDFKLGKGIAIAENLDAFSVDADEASLDREDQELDSPDILALKGLGQFRRFDAASQLRELIEGWSVSDFHIADARIEPDAAPAEHLSATGDNLALYTQYLKENHPDTFRSLMVKMAQRVPGIERVATDDTGDGRVLLRFFDKAFDKGFIARAVSDGTIKMFAYLALLHDPNPHPLLCIEEPENQLYPSLLPLLAEEFAAYSMRREPGAQVFVTTHSPDFLNEVPLESVYWLEKERGFSIIKRAADDAQLRDLIDAGDKPGWLWRQGLFEGAEPQ